MNRIIYYINYYFFNIYSKLYNNEAWTKEANKILIFWLIDDNIILVLKYLLIISQINIKIFFSIYTLICKI